MAKIENYTLHILKLNEEELKQRILSAKRAAKEAENSFNKFTTDVITEEAALKNVQDSITTLTASKKKGSKDDQ